MMERKLSVTKATEHCSCNSCHAKNYISDERFDTKVDAIYEVRIGMLLKQKAKWFWPKMAVSLPTIATRRLRKP